MRPCGGKTIQYVVQYRGCRPGLPYRTRDVSSHHALPFLSSGYALLIGDVREAVDIETLPDSTGTG